MRKIQKRGSMKFTGLGSSVLPEKKKNSIIEKQDQSCHTISRHGYDYILKQTFVYKSLTFLRLEIYRTKCETFSLTLLPSLFLVFTATVCKVLN